MYKNTPHTNRDKTHKDHPNENRTMWFSRWISWHVIMMGSKHVFQACCILWTLNQQNIFKYVALSKYPKDVLGKYSASGCLLNKTKTLQIKSKGHICIMQSLVISLYTIQLWHSERKVKYVAEDLNAIDFSKLKPFFFVCVCTVAVRGLQTQTLISLWTWMS